MFASRQNDDIRNLGFDLNAENDDPFAVPPPLMEDALLTADDAAQVGDAENIGDINPQENVDPTQAPDVTSKKKRNVDRVVLNDERLCSDKGIKALKHLCSDMQFKGKGHEVSDLNKLLYHFEHWAQCLMPKWPFQSVVEKCEVLGSKVKVKKELKRIREENDEENILRGEQDDNESEDVEVAAVAVSTEHENSVQMVDAAVELTEEQRDRIQRNRELALQRREAKRRCLEEQSQADGNNSEIFIGKVLSNSRENSKRMDISSEKTSAENQHDDDFLSAMEDDDDIACESIICANEKSKSLDVTNKKIHGVTTPYDTIDSTIPIESIQVNIRERISSNYDIENDIEDNKDFAMDDEGSADEFLNKSAFDQNHYSNEENQDENATMIENDGIAKSHVGSGNENNETSDDKLTETIENVDSQSELTDVQMITQENH
ncbi:TIMELESS-interacting protein-like isoform X2 [Xenia sp. Carnegie-2017]|uniref:TIMELESS-interacting protein-like isoform X2 n=1 Tax=Xenia sp. Carnegie-2017 TaxID=2897299 RepID=UPI001F03C109|nr:TIMELESS-interacting protein-like isoform X2 [Xenia sp. Carnegie-2017]